MKNPNILLAALMAAAASTPSRSAQPSMEFVAAPAVADSGGPESDLRRYQRDDRMTVVLRVPVECGLVPGNPSFTLNGDIVQLHYSVPPLRSDNDGPRCFSTAVFTLKGLPAKPLRTVAHPNRRPAVVANAAGAADATSPSVISMNRRT